MTKELDELERSNKMNVVAVKTTLVNKDKKNINIFNGNLKKYFLNCLFNFNKIYLAK